jgi:hypothetical protein
MMRTRQLILAIFADIINEISFIALETTESSIAGEITQVEIESGIAEINAG